MSLLDAVTPVILTYDEEPNIARTLARLEFARDIVVIDSGSTDGTLEILHADSRVRVFSRKFASHAEQWGFAVFETGIATDWILRLDADYQLTDEIIEELRQTNPSPDVAAFRIGFGYAIFGAPLRTSLYPPNTILLRRGCFSVNDKGHTEAWRVEGKIADLRSKIVHDDWKCTSRFVSSQIRYMAREIEVLDPSPNAFKTWLRRHPPLMPAATFFYAYFCKGLVLDGRAGLYYALQRLVAETILSLMLLERKIQRDGAARKIARRGRF